LVVFVVYSTIPSEEEGQGAGAGGVGGAGGGGGGAVRYTLSQK